MTAPQPSPAPKLPTYNPLGHLLALHRDPIALFDRARDFAPHCSMRMGPVTVHVITAPEHLQHVLIKNADNYVKTTRGYQVLRLVLGNGLVTNEGDSWKRQRRIANPAFHRSCIAGFADTMRNATHDYLDGLPSAPHERDVATDMHRLTLRIAGETLLGVDLSAEGDAIGGSLGIVLDQFTRLSQTLIPFADRWPTPTNRRFRRALADMDRVVYTAIATRRGEAESRADLLGMLLNARDSETDDGMNDEQLRDEVLTLLLAGHETTANALAWALYLLTQNPQWADAATDEVDRISHGAPLSFAQLAELDITARIVDETLRLYPPVWILGRKCVKDDVIDGIVVPAGMPVYMPTWSIHRHPALWTDPETFDPDRFLPERKRTLPDAAYHPFSIGRRKCIGDRFARTEAIMLLATMLQQVTFTAERGRVVVPEPTLTLRPKGGLRLRVARRS